MKYKLIKPVNPNYDAVTQILTNRGIKEEDIPHYLYTSDLDIRPPTELGEEVLKKAAIALIRCITTEKPVLIIVD